MNQPSDTELPSSSPLARAQDVEFLAGILGCAPGDLPAGSATLSEIPGWDSLKHVRLVVGLEAALGEQLSAEQIQALTTVDDVVAVLNRPDR